MQNIIDIAYKIGISPDSLEFQGNQIAKLDTARIKQPEKIGKLILVTAVTPTKFGEGKTTMSIGLSDALSKLGKKTALCLREPSLGPVFSQKGGAAGGGKASVEPSEEINLHFTGDIHAITSAHNLISAEIDNSIYWGNPLGIREVYWKRAIDLCDRSLRHDFMITAASEIMAVFALALDENDLEKRLNRITIGMDRNGGPVSVQDLGISQNLLRLLRRALKPNLVQTAEGTPAFIHGGPFANIAHGTSSMIAAKTALNTADYVITEAGFGSDLGAFKFYDIIVRNFPLLRPCAVVLVATTRAIALNGAENLRANINIIRKLGGVPVIAINAFEDDEMQDIRAIHDLSKEENVPCALSEAYSKGGEGSLEIAEAVLKIADENEPKSNEIYSLKDSFSLKADKINREIFGGAKVEISEETESKLDMISGWGFSGLPVCIAKTQYSLSADKKLSGVPQDFTLNITDAALSSGAGFVVLYSGDILTMPGMPDKFEKL
jgi:formate--tetrahydrofolate ligase